MLSTSSNHEQKISLGTVAPVLGLVGFGFFGFWGRKEREVLIVCFKVCVRIWKLWYSRTGLPPESKSFSSQTARIRAVAGM